MDLDFRLRDIYRSLDRIDTRLMNINGCLNVLCVLLLYREGLASSDDVIRQCDNSGIPHR